MIPLPKLLLTALALMPWVSAGAPQHAHQDVPGGEPPSPFVELDFEAASAHAAAEGRVLLLALVVPDSEPGQRLDETWADDGVARWIEVEAVAIEVDPATRADLVERFAVETLPTVLLLLPDGTELDRLEGAFRQRRFVKAIKGAIELRAVLSELRPRLAETPEDPNLHLQLARTYEMVERLGPAVESYEQAWQVGRGVEGFESIRTGQMLNEIGRLTQSYAPAKKALLRWRREALAKLADPTAPDAVMAAKEVAVINSFRKDVPATLELYESLRDDPEVPRAVLDELFNSQVIGTYYTQERYEELAAGFGDVFVRLDEHFTRVDLWRQKERDGTIPPGEEPMVMVLTNSLNVRSSMFLEMLLRLEREEEALQLVDLVLLREPWSKTYAALMRGARKGGSGKLAHEIADRGLATLEKKELKDFQVQVERFFKDRER